MQRNFEAGKLVLVYSYRKIDSLCLFLCFLGMIEVLFAYRIMKATIKLAVPKKRERSTDLMSSGALEILSERKAKRTKRFIFYLNLAV